jgi:hypothetical protein
VASVSTVASVETDERADRQAALAALVSELDEAFGRPDPTEVERFARRFLLADRRDT